MTDYWPDMDPAEIRRQAIDWTGDQDMAVVEAAIELVLSTGCSIEYAVRQIELELGY